MDTLGAWIEECCEIDPAADSKASLLYRNFHDWKVARGEVAVSVATAVAIEVSA
jgi:hypothetical protein